MAQRRASSLGSQPIKELTSKFRGKWLAIEVTARGATGQPMSGKVVASSESRLEVRQKVKDIKEVCIFYAGKPVPEGYGVLL